MAADEEIPFREKIRNVHFGRVPGGARDGRNAFRPIQQPVWEGGQVYDHRPNGERVPLVHEDTLKPITVKQYANNRANYEQARKELASRTTRDPKD